MLKSLRCFFRCLSGLLPLPALAGEPAPSVPPPVPGFPVGRCVRVLGVTAPEDAKKIGFEYLELALQDLLPLSDEEFSVVVARLRTNGLPALSGYGYLPADLAIVGPAVDRAKVDEHLRRGLDRARQLGVKLVVHGNLLTKGRTFPAGFPREQAWAQLVAFGRRAAAEAEARGLTVLFEPMPARSTNLVNTIAEGLALVEAVGQPNFKLLVDYGFTLEAKEDFANVTRAARTSCRWKFRIPTGASIRGGRTNPTTPPSCARCRPEVIAAASASMARRRMFSSTRRSQSRCCARSPRPGGRGDRVGRVFDLTRLRFASLSDSRVGSET